MAAAATFHLQIVTPARALFEGQVESLVAPGLEGYFGVLARHAPMIAALGEGLLTLRNGDTVKEMRVRGGFLEVSRNRAILLADEIEDISASSGAGAPA